MAGAKERHAHAFVHYDDDPLTRTRTVPMQVLLPGFSRTGTMTMKTALDALGIPTAHFITQAQNPRDLAMWTDGLRAKFEPEMWPHLAHREGKPYGREEFDVLLARYGACTDTPTFPLAEDLVQAYPDAKVVLVERDVDRWYESFCNTVIASSENAMIPLATKLDPTFMSHFAAQADLIARYKFGIRVSRTRGPWGLRNNPEFFEMYRRVAKEGYRAHYEMVRRIVPKERLLEFQLEEGWEPLCKFLGKEVPVAPFPRVNETEAVNELVKVYILEGYKRGLIRFLKRATPSLLLVFIAMLTWWWWQ